MGEATTSLTQGDGVRQPKICAPNREVSEETEAKLATTASTA